MLVPFQYYMWLTSPIYKKMLPLLKLEIASNGNKIELVMAEILHLKKVSSNCLKSWACAIKPLVFIIKPDICWSWVTRILLFPHSLCLEEVYANGLVIPSPTKLRRDIVTLPSVRPSHPCEHSRINILQWILTKLGTC